MDQNQSVDNDLQKAIDDITQKTNADPVFSNPVAAPSTIPEDDTGELAAPVGPFPDPVPESIEPSIDPTTETITPEPLAPAPVEESPANLNMKQIKEAALRDLVPIVDKLNMNPSKKFSFFKNILEELHDYTVVELAYRSASEIADDAERAEALLYLVEAIDKI